MDNLTHSLFALTLSRTPLRRAGAGATAALLLASNAPDVDIIAAVTGGGPAYLGLHRGPTHGPIGIAGLAAASAALVWGWQRGAGLRIRPGSFRRLYALSTVGVTLHVLMDLPTAYGIRLLSPFSQTWYAFDWLPIIDVYLLAGLAAGLAALWIRPRAERAITLSVFCLMLANYGLRATTHARAVASLGGTPPLFALESWPGDDGASNEKPCAGPAASGPFGHAADCRVVAAIPTFRSPFEWRGIRRVEEGYELARVNLLSPGDVVVSRTWQADQNGRWIELARETPSARVFLRFARFPAALLVHQSPTEAAVRLQDLRFVTAPAKIEAGSMPPRSLFVVTVRIGRDGRILEERLGS